MAAETSVIGTEHTVSQTVVPVLTFTAVKPGVPTSDFGGTTRLAGTDGVMCVAVTIKPRVCGGGAMIEAGVCVWKLAKGNNVTPPVGNIPAVTIGFGPVIPGVNLGTGGNISGSTGFITLGVS